MRLYTAVIDVCENCPAFTYPCFGGQPYCTRTGDKISAGDDWVGFPDWCPLEKVEEMQAERGQR